MHTGNITQALLSFYLLCDVACIYILVLQPLPTLWVPIPILSLVSFYAIRIIVSLAILSVSQWALPNGNGERRRRNIKLETRNGEKQMENDE